VNPVVYAAVALQLATSRTEPPDSSVIFAAPGRGQISRTGTVEPVFARATSNCLAPCPLSVTSSFPGGTGDCRDSSGGSLVSVAAEACPAVRGADCCAGEPDPTHPAMDISATDSTATRAAHWEK
jgi:hypothetical protein